MSCPSHFSSPPNDEFARFMLLVGLNLISSTIYAKRVKATVSLATLTALSGCCGWWSLFCYFEQLSNMFCCQHDLPCHLLLMRMQFLEKTHPSLLLMMARVSGLDTQVNSNLISTRKIVFWLCIFITWVPWCISLSYLRLPTSTLLAVPQCINTLHNCWKP